jgi:predicted NAD/FAD-dependent oxidoreductase
MTGNLPEQIVSGGGEILTNQRASQVLAEQGRVSGVVLENGRRIQADAVIAAVPPWELQSLLPYRPSWLDLALRLSWSPIVSMHWIGVNPLPIRTPVALLDSPVQWIFSRTVSSDNKRVILSTITGGDRQMASKPSREIVSLITSAIKQSFPGWNPGPDNRSVLHKIHHATISIGPGQEDLRPGLLTDLPGFWIAGDWTKTSLPPTLESAVVSGKSAAENIVSAYKLH